MKKTTLFITMFLPFFAISQQITSILPSQGNQGQTINLIISGNNMSFSGFSCWSNTGNLSEFRFSQWSSTNMFYGIANSSTTQTLSGTTNINPTQTPGIYNLEVLDCASSQWIMLPTSFEVTPGVTWECSGTGNCYDPGNGTGTYTSLLACQNNCIIPETWSCNPLTGSCEELFDGTGNYTNYSLCESECDLQLDIKNKDTEQLMIFPNPTNNTFMIKGDYTSITIYDTFGKLVFFNNTNKYKGKHAKEINLSGQTKGIYLLDIKTNKGIIRKKLTLQ